MCYIQMQVNMHGHVFLHQGYEYEIEGKIK